MRSPIRNRIRNIGAYLPGRIKLVELHAEVGRVCPRVDREANLEGGKGDPLHDAAPEIAELGDGLDRSLGEDMKRERLVLMLFRKPRRDGREGENKTTMRFMSSRSS